MTLIQRFVQFLDVLAHSLTDLDQTFEPHLWQNHDLTFDQDRNLCSVGQSEEADGSRLLRI
jgi:hypothetical protein